MMRLMKCHVEKKRTLSQLNRFLDGQDGLVRVPLRQGGQVGGLLDDVTVSEERTPDIPIIAFIRAWRLEKWIKMTSQPKG